MQIFLIKIKLTAKYKLNVSLLLSRTRGFPFKVLTDISKCEKRCNFVARCTQDVSSRASTDAFSRRRENVHALGAKCRRRWHARSWCFPARKEMSSNQEPGSGENGTTLRYIVARNIVMLRYMRTTLTSATPHNQFKRWIDYLSARCFQKMEFFVLATLYNAILACTT